jgi:hypothetical protein
MPECGQIDGQAEGDCERGLLAAPRPALRAPHFTLVVRPRPTANLGAVDPVLISMAPACNLAIAEFLFTFGLGGC